MSAGDEVSRKCYESAIRLLAIREHSRFELSQKLNAKGFTSLGIDSALDELEMQNLQSDLRYSKSLIRVRQFKGYGPVYIRNYLLQKGVGSEIIESTLDFNDPAWQKALEDTAVKKFGEAKPEDFKQKAKQMNFLLRRGFSSQQIQDFFNNHWQ